MTRDVPQSLRLYGKQVIFLAQHYDSLSNRFNPSMQIVTECVVFIDDDIKLDHEDLALLFHSWVRFDDHISGFFPRWIRDARSESEDEPLEYLTVSEDPKNRLGGYSIMLTKAMALHRKYLYAYTCGDTELHDAMHDLVTSSLNCEDIGMNFIVAQTMSTSL